MTQAQNVTSNEGILYMALELSTSSWRIAFGNGLKVRQVVLESNNLYELKEAIKFAKTKLKLREDAAVVSCYEAGRDGFWIHRYLEKAGIKNHVVDSSSIEVSRRRKQAKTDRIDAYKLLMNLLAYLRGEKKLSIVRVPSEKEEDERRTHREYMRLKKEMTSHTNRINSLLALHGIKLKNKGRMKLKDYIETCKDWEDKGLLELQKEELLREVERLELIKAQLRQVEQKMSSQTQADQSIKQLNRLRGIDKSALILIKEWFGWRKFKNRREVGSAAGLVGMPYNSGEMERDQGISKSGNALIRSLMIELSWSWLRYQPQSQLSLWFQERFGGSKRSRKVGIVALARKLLISLWRYIETGVVPEGAEFKAKV